MTSLLGLVALGVAFPMLALWGRARRVAGQIGQSPLPLLGDWSVYGVSFRLMGAGGALAWLGVLAAWGGWSPAPEGWPLVGTAVAAVGLAVLVSAQHQMGVQWRIGLDPAGTGLVTHGLYAWSRNPIYMGALLVVAGCAVAVPGLAAAVGGAVFVGGLVAVVRLEEAYLARIHGPAYAAYCARTGRWVGRWKN